MNRCFNQTALSVLIGSALLAGGCASTDSGGIAGPLLNPARSLASLSIGARLGNSVIATLQLVPASIP